MAEIKIEYLDFQVRSDDTQIGVFISSFLFSGRENEKGRIVHFYETLCFLLFSLFQKQKKFILKETVFYE